MPSRNKPCRSRNYCMHGHVGACNQLPRCASVGSIYPALISMIGPQQYITVIGCVHQYGHAHNKFSCHPASNLSLVYTNASLKSLLITPLLSLSPSPSPTLPPSHPLCGQPHSSCLSPSTIALSSFR